jgi:hypothetical protein
MYVQADANTGGATYELVASTEGCRLLALHSRLLAEDARAKRFMDAPRVR